MNEVGIEIRDSLNIDEYNNLRKQVGWEKSNRCRKSYKK